MYKCDGCDCYRRTGETYKNNRRTTVEGTPAVLEPTLTLLKQTGSAHAVQEQSSQVVLSGRFPPVYSWGPRPWEAGSIL